ncbi:MAG: hypothetical protein ABIW36_00375 [Terrimesophilobacter sp.]
MFNTLMFDSPIARRVVALTAAVLLTAAVSVAMPQQAHAATTSSQQSITLTGTATASIVTKGQKG